MCDNGLVIRCWFSVYCFGVECVSPPYICTPQRSNKKKRKSAPLEVIVHFGRPSSNGEGRLGSDWIWRWRIASIRNPILGMVLRSSCLHNVFLYVEWGPWGRLNIKMSSYQYRDHHVKYKTVSPTVLSLTWESPYLGKMVFILRQGLMVVAEAIAPGPVNMETVFPYTLGFSL